MPLRKKTLKFFDVLPIGKMSRLEDLGGCEGLDLTGGRFIWGFRVSSSEDLTAGYSDKW
jgi:hypothetical protein